MRNSTNGSQAVGMLHTANNKLGTFIPLSPPKTHIPPPARSIHDEYDDWEWLREGRNESGLQTVGMHHTANNKPDTFLPPVTTKDPAAVAPA